MTRRSPEPRLRAPLIAGVVATVAATAALAATPPPVLDARASDPLVMGWMQGDPPPPERRIAFHDRSYMQFPQLRWSFSHWRELIPTVSVPRGPGPVSALPRALRDDLDAVSFMPMATAAGERPRMTWAESLLANYTDGIVVLHRGTIVYERYAGALTETGQHIAHSVTKSFYGTLAAMLVAEGRLDERARVALSPRTQGLGVRGRHGARSARHDHRAEVLRGLHRSQRRGLGLRARRRHPAVAARLPGPEVAL
jgi:CubicO group peptidase (beta-lactamase class C family)